MHLPRSCWFVVLLILSPWLSAAQWVTQQQLLAEPPALLLDVRSANEYAAGHISGAHNISHDQLGMRLAELTAYRDQPVVVYCHSGTRTRYAIELLEAKGFSHVRHLRGDYLEWRSAGRPVVMGDAP
ncbi:rhodanese-like domain-containing protein [Atopomonas hussainii]|uniref:rhodanese-like domain-containing protein n=1 Tax=Atopomonas hussainii TaxID=1429083 RepID=UPI0009003321|nr:rhodanese-like domain-containing protein [Atopomonas hussainii]